MLDWKAPWYEPWCEPGERVARRQGEGVPLHEALADERGAPVQFVSQDELPAGVADESFIRRTGRCPTRDNLHDFFNGLAWLQFPEAKRRLNQLQAAEIEAGQREVRGPVRDAITVFDESGAVLHAPAQLWKALQDRDWKRLFVELRPLWVDARVIVLGHALLEKLAAPRKEMTAHVWCAPCPAGSLAEVDEWLACQFEPDSLAAKPFTPLPLLGIPGWWPGNEDFSFYDDSLVFRPARRQNEKTTARPAASRP